MSTCNCASSQQSLSRAFASFYLKALCPTIYSKRSGRLKVYNVVSAATAIRMCTRKVRVAIVFKMNYLEVRMFDLNNFWCFERST